ncbi:alpha/beta fold hydrolase [Streptomyces sp. NPDC006134]|uniref:alpha/beta fold hydrolase n=1 Tax=Streptomyces sp. NPDC006134 TaxID=3154467 RepID=UPI0033FE6000
MTDRHHPLGHHHHPDHPGHHHHPDHYDVSGSGPVLLVVPGGAGHPMGLDRMTAALSARFTVVTYDPLGLAHGRLGLPVPEQRVALWSEGARRVLDAVLADGAQAHVLGMSSGGIAALDLLARHPHRLRHVIAHEPPTATVLPDGARERLALLEQLGEPASATDEPADPMGVFLARVVRPFTAYTPDLDALRARASRLTLAAGSDSRNQLPYRTAAFLAERTGGGFAEFPGGHLGAIEHPEEFAERVAERLGG